MIKTHEDQAQLQFDIIRIIEWSKKWQLPFNIDKCCVMHYGYSNVNADYHMNTINISEENLQRDLGINFDSNLKFSKHIGVITKKANSRLGIIKRTFQSLSPDIFLPLYKTLVRPILEYCSCVWSPMLKKDMIEIEKVQRRATKMVKGFNTMEYNERLYRLNLDSLHFRRKRGDLLQVYKILKGIENIESNKFFSINQDRTRGHCLKLFKKQSNCNLRLHSFSQRVIKDWNGLNEETVRCETLNSFKTALKREWCLHPERYDMP